MKIVKSNNGIRKTFDTESNVIEKFEGNINDLDYLSIAGLTHYEYFSKVFGKEHEIMQDFNNSYYYTFPLIQNE